MQIDQMFALHERIGFALESLDIPPELLARAAQVYEDVGRFVLAHDADAGRREPEFFTQGSAALGTATYGDDWDIDGVYTRQLSRESTTQEILKSEAGVVLARFAEQQATRGESVPTIVERDRCWRLEYNGFHVDVLPAIPEVVGAASSTRLLIADRDPSQRAWLLTDPRAYIAWFVERMGPAFADERRLLAESSGRALEQVPVWETKTVLQRAVQFLRRHRDEHYGPHEQELRPCSMLITTIAAQAYGGETTIPGALQTIAAGLSDPTILENRDGDLWVANPTNPAENLARDFEGDQRRTDRLATWIATFREHVTGLGNERGVRLDRLMADTIGEEPAMAASKRAAVVLTERRNQGALRMAGGSGMLGTSGAVPVPRHTFDGHPKP